MLAVLWPARQLYFSSDDFEWLSAARRAIAAGFAALPADVNGHFRPLVELVWLLEFHVFGTRPEGYYTTTLLVHALVASLVGLAAARGLGEPRAGVVAGLLFGVSLVHRGVVTWASAAPDLWLGLLGALALALASGPRPRPRIALLVAGLAGLAKETGVAVPLMLLLVSPAVRRDRRVRLGGVVLVAVLLLAHLHAIRSSAYVQGRFEPGWHMLPRAVESVGALLVPTGVLPPGSAAAAGVSLLGALGVPVVTALAARRMGAAPALGWLGAALFALGPALLARGELESRWLYLPLVAFAPLLAAALLALLEPVRRRAGTGGANALLVLLVGLHVLTHGIAMRLKIDRAMVRDAWVRGLVEGAARNPPELRDGDVVQVQVPFGAELRFWPLGVELAVGRSVQVQPIDDRTEPAAGVALLDATTSPSRWR